MGSLKIPNFQAVRQRLPVLGGVIRSRLLVPAFQLPTRQFSDKDPVALTSTLQPHPNPVCLITPLFTALDQAKVR
jgi:hypothetical protein